MRVVAIGSEGPCAVVAARSGAFTDDGQGTTGPDGALSSNRARGLWRHIFSAKQGIRTGLDSSRSPLRHSAGLSPDFPPPFSSVPPRQRNLRASLFYPVDEGSDFFRELRFEVGNEAEGLFHGFVFGEGFGAVGVG